MRKLLPYEHHLIETLGISEEEYWQFYLARLNYKDEKQGTIFDVRNEAGTVALVLTIIGTLAQVGAAILAPKPQAPSQKMGKGARNLFFAPRYGFNSFQEVARYGEPVNLVYTNIDENKTAGGVRVNTSLVWSAVHSLGTRQYMQMLGVVGAGPIEQFGYGRTAFGQTPLRNMPAQRLWLYANESSGRLVFNDKKLGDDRDPSNVNVAPSELVYKTNITGANRPDGFSQAFSPTTATSLGLYDVVPIKVKVEDRDDDGKNKQDSLGINISSGRGQYWPDKWPTVGVRPSFPKGRLITIKFEEDDRKPTEDVERAAIDLRSAYITTFDSSSLYKIGAAKFKLVSDDISDGSDIEGQFTFECTDAGVLCEEDYGTMRYQQNEEDLRKQKKDLEEYINSVLLPGKGAAFAERYVGPGLATIAAFDAQLEAIDNDIEDATAVLGGNISRGDFLNIIRNQGAFSGKMREINELEDQIKRRNQEIDNARDEIDAINDEIDEILARRPFGNSDRNDLRRRRSNKQEKKDRIRRKTDEKKVFKQQVSEKTAALMADAIEFGMYDNKRGTNLREERRALKRTRRSITKRRTEAASNVSRDFAAESAAQNTWNQQYNTANQQLASVNRQLKDPDSWNDYFNNKCIAKVDEIEYEATTKCDIVNFCFKSKVFQRVQGRMNKYAEVDMQGHKDSDNGMRNRTALFWMLYKKPTDLNYTRAPYVLAVRNGKEVDIYTHVRFVGASKEKWQFKFEPIVDLAAELRTHNDGAEIDVLYLRSFGYGLNSQQRQLNIGGGNALIYRGRSPRRTKSKTPPLNRTPAFIDEWGLFSLRSDTQLAFSFDAGAETMLTAVTEQQRTPFTADLYKNLSMIGLNIYSGQGVQDLRSLSAWVLKGKKVRKLSDNGAIQSTPSTSTSYAPEIFLDTVLDVDNGIGVYANINGIDTTRLGQAQKFCRANEYYMDGVIAEPQSWREFWSTVAPFSLLEFARIGGKETLVPAVPYDVFGKVSRNISISALFNQGNILEGSYKEEFLDYGDNTQDLIATIVYRDTENDNVFPSNQSVTIALADSVESASIRQTFDLSNFVSRKTQAIHYGMLLCQQRRWSKRAIEFQTFPTESPVEPGSYIYVQTDQNQWDDFYSGVVEQDGFLNAPLAEDPINGTYTALLYNGKDNPTKLSSVSVSNNQSSSLAAYENWLFVLGAALTTKRVFRVTEVTMEEQGEITIRAIEHPCEEESGQTKSLIVRFDLGLFKPID
jgi:hypothetical protein